MMPQLRVRAVQRTDLADILELAHIAGQGLTSLPPNEPALLKKINCSIKTFARRKSHPSDYFLLVMEDTAKQKIVGTAAIYTKTGAAQAFYAYRLVPITHYSHSLNKEIRSDLLQLTNDYTDCSEVSALFIHPDYRGNGGWLSKSRYMLMGEFAKRFAPFVIAQIRGYTDQKGRSPFWRAIGEKFFDMDFAEADYLCGIETNQFITELMPKYPIYCCLIPKSVRQVIGKPNFYSHRALKLLQKEGFIYEQMVDIFDAGPILRAPTGHLKTVRHLQKKRVQIGTEVDAPPTLVASARLSRFCAIYTPAAHKADAIVIDRTRAELLEVKKNDSVLCLSIL